MIFYSTNQKPSSDPITINFPMIKGATPVVLATPFWKDQSQPVPVIETVTQVSPTSCQISSSNHGDKYFVNVLAIDATTTLIGSLSARAGNEMKPLSGATTIDFSSHLKSNDPVVLLTPQWTGSPGFVDYLNASAASEITIYSQNAASDYSFNYLATDRGATHIMDAGPVAIPLETGTYNKTGPGKYRIYFDTLFSKPPTVFLSPWWNGSQNDVGSIETLTKVTTEYFEAVSNNADQNYYVNWVAFGAQDDPGVSVG